MQEIDEDSFYVPVEEGYNSVSLGISRYLSQLKYKDRLSYYKKDTHLFK